MSLVEGLDDSLADCEEAKEIGRVLLELSSGDREATEASRRLLVEAGTPTKSAMSRLHRCLSCMSSALYCSFCRVAVMAPISASAKRLRSDVFSSRMASKSMVVSNAAASG